MWTSERSRNLPVREAAAELGTVTLGGDPAGVSLGGERRWLTVYSPGGYSWRPSAGDRVLVLKAGAEGESPCVLGAAQNGGELKSGEARLDGGICGVLLGQDGLELKGGESEVRLEEKELSLKLGSSGVRLGGGRTELTGELYLNGRTLYDVVQSIVADLLG